MWLTARLGALELDADVYAEYEDMMPETLTQVVTVVEFDAAAARVATMPPRTKQKMEPRKKAMRMPMTHALCDTSGMRAC